MYIQYVYMYVLSIDIEYVLLIYKFQMRSKINMRCLRNNE